MFDFGNFNARAKAIFNAFLVAVGAALTTAISGLDELVREVLQQFGEDGTATAVGAAGGAAAAAVGAIRAWMDKNLKKGEGDE
ncbi:MAG: hypothetical protein AAF968_04690 [Pseudomonadota bacterium]